MTLSIGIVGLPNVGKSTLFNALTSSQNAQVANYPFCTIEPNKAIVPVPDERLQTLARILEVPNAVPATVEFVDIAGLVAGASRGEGLGNQFLGHVRDAAALVHLVRCFDDPNVAHINAQPQPRADIAIINTELMLADLEQVERKLEKLERQVKGDRQTYLPQLQTAQALHAHLAEGNPASSFAPQDGSFQALNQELRLLSAKPVIFAANVDEASAAAGNAFVREVEAVAAATDSELVTVCASLEAELAALAPQEREEYLELVGVEMSGLADVVRSGYRLLGLISYFSYNDSEVRAWTIEEGWTAPRAAGVIHGDFERGFIRAEVVPYEQFVEYGSSSAVKAAGKLRSEGREYVVQDGDVIYFRFNL